MLSVELEEPGARQDAIRENYRFVLERISESARSVGRDPSEVKLVVVTKGHPIEVVRSAVAAGARLLGENYAEEGVEKINALGEIAGLEWHMIGHIQGRKARMVCEYYHYVHSLDSIRLAERLERFASEWGRVLPVLLECNVSGEETKYGFPAWRDEHWVELREWASKISGFPHLELRGLMTMAPFFDDPELARPYFKRLALLRNYLAERLSQAKWDELSMGMSADFEVSVQEGATLVRVGQAILGPRPA